MHQAAANAPAASRINCDCVARDTLRCRSHSPRAALLIACSALMSLACSFTSRRDPHSTACSVLANVGMLKFFNDGQFIGRYLDESTVRPLHPRTLFACDQAARFWR